MSNGAKPNLLISIWMAVLSFYVVMQPELEKAEEERVHIREISEAREANVVLINHIGGASSGRRARFNGTVINMPGQRSEESEYVITVAHGCSMNNLAVDKLNRIYVQARNGYRTRETEVVHVDHSVDLCLLRMSSALPSTNPDLNYVGQSTDELYLVAAALGIPYVTARGELFGATHDGDMYISNVAVTAGFSGAGMYHDGRLVSVVSAYTSEYPHCTLSAATPQLSRFLYEALAER